MSGLGNSSLLSQSNLDSTNISTSRINASDSNVSKQSLGNTKEIVNEKNVKINLINKYLGRHLDKREELGNIVSIHSNEGEGNVSPRSQYNQIMSKFISFENAYQHTDVAEVESDTTQQLRKRYSNSLAFKNQEYSLNEKLLEFSLEEELKLRNELIKQRRESLTSLEDRKVFSGVPSSRKISLDDDVKSLRKLREQVLTEIKSVPKIEFQEFDLNLYKEIIESSAESKNTLHFTKELLLQFYNSRCQELKREKFLLLNRFSKFMNTTELSDRTDVILQTRLRNLNEEFVIVKDRLTQLKLSNKFNSDASQDDLRIKIDDFRHYIRSVIIKNKIQKKLHFLLKKIKWITHTERERLFLKSAEGSDTKNQTEPPYMTTSYQEIEDQLEELKDCFDLSKINIEGDQEFLYAVTKRFAAVFHAQQESLNFLEYPLHLLEDESQRKDNSFDEVRSSIQNIADPDKIYLKTLPWNTESILKKRIFDRKQRQEVLQESVTDIDTLLRVETDFLRENDLSYAQKRLRDLSESHMKRAYVKQTVNIENNGGEFRIPSLQGGKSAYVKLQSVYLLRYIRIREFRRKLLDLFNYFRSIERRLSLDASGWYIKEDKLSSFIARVFPSPDDLEPIESDSIMQQFTVENRDDSYELKQNRDILVQDTLRNNIMYKDAIKDLEKREVELLKIGSHFIIQNYDENRSIEVDRILVVEDLYESEAWYQDGKRKILECYMEAYEQCTSPEKQKHLAQVILDIIHTKPQIDTSASYFSESYAAEIIGLELQYSLLRDVINYQMNEEKKYVRYLYQSFEPRKPRNFGIPNNFIDDSKLEIKLFPGASKIGFVDFYNSLSELGFLHDYIENAVDNLVYDFKLENPMVISSLKRAIVQQSIVEWKLLTEEEKIQKNIHLTLSDDRRAIEDVPIMEDTEEILKIIQNTIQEYNQVDGKQKFDINSLMNTNAPSDLPSAERLPTTIGGFPFKKESPTSQKEAISLQTYANAVEMIYMWIGLLNQLYETDILNNIYKNQCNKVGVSIESNLTDPINFGNDQKRGVSMVHSQEVVSIRSQFLSNIAISEFEQSMAEFNFATQSGIKKVINPPGLNELRLALQFQFTQRILYQVIASYNQVLFDDLLINGGDDSVFLTSMPSNTIQHIYETKINEELVRELMLYSDDVKDEIRKLAVEAYKEESAKIAAESGGNVLIKSKLRELKFILAGRYCYDMLQYLTPFIQKTQLIRHIGELRSKILILPDNNYGFIIGSQNDRLPRSNRYTNQGKPSVKDSTCLMAQDGTIVNSIYVPHYIQVLKMSFVIENSDAARDISTKIITERFSQLIRITQCYYMILSINIATAHSAVSAFTSLTRSALGLDQIGQQIKKIQTEIEHLQKPESAELVVQYLTNRSNSLYMKQLTALRHLQLKLDLLGNHAAAKKLNESYNEFIHPSSLIISSLDTFLLRTKFIENATVKYPILTSSRSTSIELVPLSTSQYRILNRFLLEMSEAVRNMYNAEEIATDLVIEDHLQRKHVYSTSMPEDAVLLSINLLESMQQLWLLKDQFFILLRRHYTSEFFDNSEKMEELFSVIVIRETRRIYEQNINEHNRELQMQLVKISNGTDENDATIEHQKQEIQSKMKHKDELEFRQKQVQVATLEVHKLMLIELINVVKRQVIKIRDELRNEIEDEHNPNGSRITIFQDLLQNIFHHSTKTRSKNNEVIISIVEKHLQDALDECGYNLNKWKEQEIRDFASELNTMILHYKRLAVSYKQRLDFSNYKSDLDKKSFNRRVETEVADHNYDLVFQVDTVTRENRELNEHLQNVKQEVKEEVKKEYESLIQQMTKELLIQKTRFNDFRTQFYKNLDEKFSKVKEETLVKIEDAKRQGGATLMQKQALKVVVEDNELAKLKRFQADAIAYEEKLQVMNKLKLLTVKGKLERQLNESENEKEATNKMYWTNKVKIEERENLLRQELLKLQQELSNSQMEITELKKEVSIQKKNKQKLRIWKVKNKQLLDELESKVKSFEKWNKYDVDKLLLEKERLMEEVQKYAKMEARLSKQSQIVERKSQRQVQEIKRRLNHEQKLKSQAFMKLEEVRLEGGNESFDFSRPSTSNSASMWHKRYLDAMSELQLTIKENAIMKEQMRNAGVDIPIASPVSSRFPSRPNSIRQASFSMRSEDNNISAESVLPSPGSKSRGIIPSYRSSVASTPSTPSRSLRSSLSQERRSGSASTSLRRKEDMRLTQSAQGTR